MALPSARSAVKPDALAALVSGRYADAFSVLGPHLTADHQGTLGTLGTLIRTFQPQAESVSVHVKPTDANVPMTRTDPGVFEIIIPGDAIPDYRLRVVFR